MGEKEVGEGMDGAGGEAGHPGAGGGLGIRGCEAFEEGFLCMGGWEGMERRGEILEVVVGAEAQGGGEVGGSGDLGAAAAVVVMAGEAVQS